MAVLEERLAVAKQAEVELLWQTTDQTRIHQDTMARLINEKQKAEMDHMVALDTEKKGMGGCSIQS